MQEKRMGCRALEQQMKTLAIVMAAYQSQDYIVNAINSLTTQGLPDDWQMKMYVGVDNCSATAKVLDDNNISYYWAKENVGTYIMANSLLREAQGADMFLRFDSDDQACDSYLFNGIRNCEQYEFSHSFCQYCDENMKPHPRKPFAAHGQCFYTPAVLEKIGGYEPFRVACDTFFMERAKASGFDIRTQVEVSKQPVFLYRKHSQSLTKSKETSPRSTIRRDTTRKLQANLKQKKFKIDPVTTTLEYRQQQ